MIADTVVADTVITNTVITSTVITSTVITNTWRSMRPGTRAVVGVLAIVLVLNLLTAGVTVVTGGSGPGGPTSSSFATGADGLAAYAELLARHGHPVQQLRVSLDDAELDPGTTLVLADPQRITDEEGRALAAFVTAGGRLVAAGLGVEPVLAGLPGGGPEWAGGRVDPAVPLLAVPEVAGVTTVEAGGSGVWRRAGGMVPVLGEADGVLAAVATVGRGRVVALADSSPLQNRLLARADNAAFALNAVGEGRPVAFAEAQHGYGQGTGLSALPSRWRWAIAGGFLAALVWMWSRGRRLGPADEIERPAPPARRAYVEAMAGALARTRQPDVVVAPLQDRARRRLATRAGLPPDAGEDVLREAASQLRMAPEEIDALFRPCQTEADVVAVGRALAFLMDGHLTGAGAL